ncbi:hypothetical protein CF319_g6096 [Tilletia indica]|nr:hypothetical protein CF319_g6096 [Tilletia indica]
MSATRTAARLDYVDIPALGRRIELSDGEEDGEPTNQQRGNEDVQGEDEDVQGDDEGDQGGDNLGRAPDVVDDSEEAESSTRAKTSRNGARNRPARTRKPAVKARTRKSGASRAPSTRKKPAPRRSSPRSKDAKDTKSATSETSAAIAASEADIEHVESAVQLWSPDTPALYGLDAATVQHLNPAEIAQSVRSSLDRNNFVVNGDEELHRQLILKATIAACVATCITRAH